MARPQKQGLDYFPLDVDIDQVDDNIMILEAKYGPEGFSTLIKLYMKIYQDKGYYCNWGEKESLLHSKRVNVDNNRIIDIINDMVEWGIFDKEKYQQYQILTSKGVQKRYLEATQRRTNIDIVDEYYLLDTVNDNINFINVNINPQRKEKKRKEKKSKEVYSDIFDYYNSLDIVKHQRLTDSMKKAIDKVLDKYSIDEVKELLLRHSKVVNLTKDNGKYAVRKRQLDIFFSQKISNEAGSPKHYEEYLDGGAKYEQYLNNKEEEQGYGDIEFMDFGGD